jgi:hypothetical protein
MRVSDDLLNGFSTNLHSFSFFPSNWLLAYLMSPIIQSFGDSVINCVCCWFPSCLFGIWVSQAWKMFYSCASDLSHPKFAYCFLLSHLLCLWRVLLLRYFHFCFSEILGGNRSSYRWPIFHLHVFLFTQIDNVLQEAKFERLFISEDILVLLSFG